MRTLGILGTGLFPLVVLAVAACGESPAAAPTLEPQPTEPVSDDDLGGDLGTSASSGGTTSGSSASSGGGTDPAPVSDELCDNGLDDDGDGLADEACPCDEGVEQLCFLGDPGKAGKAACAMGKQACVGAGDNEFSQGTWGACVGSGIPQTCTEVGATCGTADDGCGGTIACDDECSACTPGEKVFDKAGTFQFSVPGYASLVVKVWGAGGGGGAYGAKTPASDGEASTFGDLVAEGGKGGIGGGGSAKGGAATGGMTNLPGGNGQGACDKGYPSLCGTAAGGNAPEGGKGGSGVSAVDGCQGGDGKSGGLPGGGGAGAWACLGPWWVGYGWGYGGGGAGAGAYATTSFTKGELAAGKSVSVKVGSAGKGALGVMSDGQSGTGKNAGFYTGGDGGDGKVVVSWTCP